MKSVRNYFDFFVIRSQKQAIHIQLRETSNFTVIMILFKDVCAGWWVWSRQLQKRVKNETRTSEKRAKVWSWLIMVWLGLIMATTKKSLKRVRIKASSNLFKADFHLDVSDYANNENVLKTGTSVNEHGKQYHIGS